MDTRSGELRRLQDIEQMAEDEKKHFTELTESELKRLAELPAQERLDELNRLREQSQE